VNGLLEFASPAWLDLLEALLHEAVAKAGAAADGVEFSVSETYLSAPRHLAPPDVAFGWHVRIADGEVAFRPVPALDVSVRVVGDYDALHELARGTVGTEPGAERALGRLAVGLVAEGRLRIDGDVRQQPEWLGWIHDALAQHTA
jgi:hypothetical protein